MRTWRRRSSLLATYRKPPCASATFDLRGDGGCLNYRDGRSRRAFNPSATHLQQTLALAFIASRDPTDSQALTAMIIIRVSGARVPPPASHCGAEETANRSIGAIWRHRGGKGIGKARVSRHPKELNKDRVPRRTTTTKACLLWTCLGQFQLERFAAERVAEPRPRPVRDEAARCLRG